MRLTTRLAMATAVVAAVSLVLALPASTNGIPTTGTQIGLFNQTPLEFPASTPFYIEHGQLCEVPKEVTVCTNPGTHFDLYLDGVRQPSKLDMDLVQGHPRLLTKRYLTNYPNGLVGTHTFRGETFVNGELSGTHERTITFD